MNAHNLSQMLLVFMVLLNCCSFLLDRQVIHQGFQGLHPQLTQQCPMTHHALLPLLFFHYSYLRHTGAHLLSTHLQEEKRKQWDSTHILTALLHLTTSIKIATNHTWYIFLPVVGPPVPPAKPRAVWAGSSVRQVQTPWAETPPFAVKMKKREKEQTMENKEECASPEVTTGVDWLASLQ